MNSNELAFLHNLQHGDMFLLKIPSVPNSFTAKFVALNNGVVYYNDVNGGEGALASYNFIINPDEPNEVARVGPIGSVL